MDNINNLIQRNQRQLQEANKEILQRNQRDRELQEETLAVLKGIELNTRHFHDITNLIKQSNENQEKIFDIFVEILAINKAVNKEDAETRYQKVMKRIGELNDGYGATTLLYKFAGSTYEFFDKVTPFNPFNT